VNIRHRVTARLTEDRLYFYTGRAMARRSTTTAMMITTMRKHGGRAVVSLRLDTN
jgi:hypothetical protein